MHLPVLRNGSLPEPCPLVRLSGAVGGNYSGSTPEMRHEATAASLCSLINPLLIDKYSFPAELSSWENRMFLGTYLVSAMGLEPMTY